MLGALAGAQGFAGTLTICGEGALRPRLEALAARAGVARRVTFAGHCRDVTPYLAQGSALVLVTHSEAAAHRADRVLHLTSEGIVGG